MGDAVRNTYDFLLETDFLYYKEQIPFYFSQLALWGYEAHGKLVGFMGISNGKLEMLFILDNCCRGRGIGKELLLYGIHVLNLNKVDVNEQNTQALEFYKYMGFSTVGRSEGDREGKEYPILHMVLH